MDTNSHNDDRTYNHPNSDVWHVVLVAFAQRKETIHPVDIAAAAGVTIHEVQRTLATMSNQGLVEWSTDDNGAVVPGEVATEFLTD